jgi:dTDP-4-dehydrorhamnose reductase
MATIFSVCWKKRSTSVSLDADNRRILITGTSGQVGGELVRTLVPLGEIFAPTRAELNLSDTASIQACIRGVRPRWIVNAAAYTAVDKAESEPVLAFAINAEAVRTIGIEARTFGAAVLHFSTDYVFNGRSTNPYVETDSTNPLNVYGASKLAGERALLETNEPSLICRTSWVYGATGKNFLRTILKLARERDNISVVADQHGSPTWSRDLAFMAAHVIAHCERIATETLITISEATRQFAGIYHASASGETTWAAFAEEAIRQVNARESFTKVATIIPITTAEYPTPAARPANSRMSNEKLFQTFGWRMMDWHDALTQVLGELA